MSRLYGELSARRSGEKHPEPNEGSTPQAEHPPETTPSAPERDTQDSARTPLEAALRHEIERLRQEVDRQKALARDRDQVLQERESKARAQLDELEAARQRIAVLDDRQRQFAEKIRLSEVDLRNARQDAKDSKEGLEYERQLRAADAGRLADMDAELQVQKGRCSALEEAKGGLATRLAELQRESESRAQSLQTELRNARDRVVTLEDRQRQFADKLRSVEPSVQVAQSEARQARETLASREAALKNVESQNQVLSTQLAAAQRAEAAAHEAAKATEERAARDQASQRLEFENRLAEVGKQGGTRVASLQAELSTARQRIETLEDRQRQMAVKVGATDKDLSAARALAQQVSETLAHEKQLHEATSARLNDAEAMLRDETAARKGAEQREREQVASRTELERRLSVLSGEKDTAAKAFEGELKTARERVATLEDRQRQFAEKLRIVEPSVQAAQTEARQAREALAAAQDRESALSGRLAEFEARFKSETSSRLALEKEKEAIAGRCVELEKQVAVASKGAGERIQALESELRASRERVSVLDDRQRQFAEKLRIVEPSVQAAQTEARQAREALAAAQDRESTLSGRLAEFESRFKTETSSRLALEKEQETSAGRCAELEKQVAVASKGAGERIQALESELRASRERVGVLEDRQRQFAAKIQSVGPELAAARAEAQQASEALTRVQVEHQAESERLATLKKELEEQTGIRLEVERAGADKARRCSDLEKELESVRRTHAEAIESERTEAARSRTEMADRSAGLERQVASAVAERDRLTREKEDAIRVTAKQIEDQSRRGGEMETRIMGLEGELKAARERVAVAEDRQRQFADKVRTNEAERRADLVETQKVRDALDLERQSHAATSQRLTDVESGLRNAEQERAARDVALRESDARLTAVKVELGEAREALKQAEAAALEALDRSEHQLGARCAELERDCKAVRQERDRVAKESGERIRVLEGELAAALKAIDSGAQALESERQASRDKAKILDEDLAKERQLRDVTEKECRERDRVAKESGERIRVLEGELAAALKAIDSGTQALESERQASRDKAKILDEDLAKERQLRGIAEKACREHERLAREGEDRARVAEDKLALVSERVRELENSQRQSAENVQSSEAVLLAAQDEARRLSEALVREQQMHATVSGRITDLESQMRKREEEVSSERAEEKGRDEALIAVAEGRLAEEAKRRAADGLSAKVSLEKSERAVVEAEGRCRELGARVSQTEADRSELRKQVKDLEDTVTRNKKVQSDMGAKLARYERELEAVAGVGPGGWRRRMSGAPASALAGGLIVVCAVAFAAGVLLWPKGEAVDAPTTVKNVVTVTKVESEPVAPSKLRPVEWPVLQDSGVQVTVTENERVIVFDKGVFVRYAEIGLPARDSLRALASQMKPFLGRLRLEVEGHTDSDPLVGHPTHADNNALGQARADAVLAFLRDDCGLPASSMVATSAGSERPPYPNDTLEGKRKNRTVVLHLRVVPAQ